MTDNASFGAESLSIQGTMATASSLSALLNELREFRAEVSARGPILEVSETWNDFAREGLD